MKNTIAAGDYKAGIPISYSLRKDLLYFEYKKPGLFAGSEKVFISKDTVEGYEVVSEESKKSVSSGVAKGIVGGALFGGVGALAGAVSGKQKGIHRVAIAFKDGKRILCDLDDFYYKVLTEKLF